MARVITGTLTEPDGDVITGTLKFVAEDNSANTPKTSEGEIAVSAGSYSGEINEGTYTVKLVYPSSITGMDNVAVLGKSVVVTNGADIDVISLCGLTTLPSSLTLSYSYSKTWQIHGHVSSALEIDPADASHNRINVAADIAVTIAEPTGIGPRQSSFSLEARWEGAYTLTLPPAEWDQGIAPTTLRAAGDEDEYMFKVRKGADWPTSTAVTLGEMVTPSTWNGYIYECTTAGTTGSTEPTWGTTVGGTTADGTAVWTCRYATRGYLTGSSFS